MKSQLSSKEVEVPRNCAYVMVANFTSEELVISKATILGVVEEISETLVDCINADSDQPTKPCRKRRNEALYQNLLHGKLDHIHPEERQILEPVLLKYAHVFHDEATNDFKGTNVTELEILVGDARPIRRPP